MANENQFEAVVFRAIDRVNELLLDVNTLKKTGGTILLGEGAKLDSMGFVNFVVAFEEAAAEQLKLNINLVEQLNAKDGSMPGPLTVARLVALLQRVAEPEVATGD